MHLTYRRCRFLPKENVTSHFSLEEWCATLWNQIVMFLCYKLISLCLYFFVSFLECFIYLVLYCRLLNLCTCFFQTNELFIQVIRASRPSSLILSSSFLFFLSCNVVAKKRISLSHHNYGIHHWLIIWGGRHSSSSPQPKQIERGRNPPSCCEYTWIDGEVISLSSIHYIRVKGGRVLLSLYLINRVGAEEILLSFTWSI